MKTLTLSGLLTLLLISCENNKHYKYVEVTSEDGSLLSESKTKDINAVSDSAAYLEAYKDFCISQKVAKNMKEAFGDTYSSPVKFKLVNEKGDDITNSVFFMDKPSKEKEIENMIFSMNNSLKEAVDNNAKETAAKFQASNKVDSAKLTGLLRYFRKKKDEFSPDNLVWYKPKSAPAYTNRNGIYCYFQTENGVPSNLRFRIQYYAEDWLFFKEVQFSIDGKAYDYIPSKTETDSGDGGYIWEWFDESLGSSDKDLITALSNAKSAKMKFIGRQYYDVKVISQEQINSIKETLELYEAMGGQF